MATYNKNRIAKKNKVIRERVKNRRMPYFTVHDDSYCYCNDCDWTWEGSNKNAGLKAREHAALHFHDVSNDIRCTTTYRGSVICRSCKGEDLPNGKTCPHCEGQFSSDAMTRLILRQDAQERQQS